MSDVRDSLPVTHLTVVFEPPDQAYRRLYGNVTVPYSRVLAKSETLVTNAPGVAASCACACSCDCMCTCNCNCNCGS